MINNIFSWHSYIILNIALALSYVVTRAILSAPLFRHAVSQAQQLRFVKTSFAITLATIMIVPWLIANLGSDVSNKFQLQPIISQATTVLLQQHTIVDTHEHIVAAMPQFISITAVLFMFFLSGFAIALYKYIKSVITLRKLAKSCFIYKRINNVTLLFNSSSHVPFCWSIFNKHFVLIPETLLGNPIDMQLAISHEFQHLRQGDTHWLHFFAIIKLICFCNPFIKLWSTWLGELQEYACDEALVLKNTAAPLAYADCLLNVAQQTLDAKNLPQLALGIFGFSKINKTSILQRRISMLFNYKPLQKRNFLWLIAYTICFLTMASAAYALSNNNLTGNVTAQYLAALIQKSDPDNLLRVTAVPEVVTEINNIRSSDHAKEFMSSGLERMKPYKTMVLQQLKNNGIPADFLAMPLIQSGYQSLNANKNPVHAAGIWQFIPSTAKNFNLVINDKQDDRLNPQLSIAAAAKYLNTLYAHFHDWRLVAVAYEIGAKATDQLIKTTGSLDAWTLARSPSAPKELKTVLSTFDAAIVIMHNPSLLNK